MPRTIANTPTGICRNNTRVDTSDGLLAVTLHHTLIVETLPGGSITLDTGGWDTVTTRRRMNQALSYLESDWRVARTDGHLHLVNVFSRRALYFDRECVIYPDGSVVSDQHGESR